MLDRSAVGQLSSISNDCRQAIHYIVCRLPTIAAILFYWIRTKLSNSWRLTLSRPKGPACSTCELLNTPLDLYYTHTTLNRNEQHDAVPVLSYDVHNNDQKNRNFWLGKLVLQMTMMQTVLFYQPGGWDRVFYNEHIAAMWCHRLCTGITLLTTKPVTNVWCYNENHTAFCRAHTLLWLG